MHIALCGAGGTGKGTIAAKLEEEKYLFLKSPVEYFTKLMFPEAKNYQDIPFLNKIQEQYAVVTAEMMQEQMRRDNDYVAERSVFDFLPYTYQAIQREYKTDTTRIELSYSKYRNYVYRYLEREKPYDIIFFFPIEFDPEDKAINSWKERDAMARIKTQRFLEAELKKVSDDIPVFVIHGTVEERLLQIKQALVPLCLGLNT